MRCRQTFIPSENKGWKQWCIFLCSSQKHYHVTSCTRINCTVRFANHLSKKAHAKLKPPLFLVFYSYRYNQRRKALSLRYQQHVKTECWCTVQRVMCIIQDDHGLDAHPLVTAKRDLKGQARLGQRTTASCATAHPVHPG